MTRHRSTITPAQKKQILELFAKGVRKCDIAKEMKIKHASVSSVITYHNKPVPVVKDSKYFDVGDKCWVTGFKD